MAGEYTPAVVTKGIKAFLRATCKKAARQRPAAPGRLGGDRALDRLIAAVGGVGCSVLLADRDGVVVERRGAPCDDSTFDGWGLWTGAVWSEKFEGTNGIGTCLVEQRAVTIDRDQHFFTRNALLSCTTGADLTTSMANWPRRSTSPLAGPT